MLDDDTVRENTILMLAYIYRSVPWQKMSTGKSAWDIWNHRVRHCATRATLGAAISRLCNTVGLQSVPEPAMILYENLLPYQDRVLRLLYEEHIPVAVQSALRARKIRATNQLTLEEVSDGAHSED